MSTGTLVSMDFIAEGFKELAKQNFPRANHWWE